MRSKFLAGVLGIVVVAGCADGGPAATGRVQVGVATDASAAGTTGEGALFADTYVDTDGNTLVLDSAAVVLRKVKLEGENGLCVDDDDEIGDSIVAAADSGHAGDDDACEVEIRLGPMLVELPLNGGVAHQFTASVDTGTYDEVKFQIHVPSGSNDAAFLLAHPEYEGVSIRVVGTYNGTPFVFTTGVTDVQQVDLDPPLVVTEGTASFTLMIDLSGWFRTGAGKLVDPATALGDGANATLVHQNIIRSIHGFGDEDHDGHDDHDD